MNSDEINLWLDNEMDEHSRIEFEQSIYSDDSLQLRLYEQIELNAALKAHYQPETNLCKSIMNEILTYRVQSKLISKKAIQRKRAKRTWQVILCAAAALIIFSFSLLITGDKTVPVGQVKNIKSKDYSIVIVGPAEYKYENNDLTLLSGSLLAEIHSKDLQVNTPNGVFRDKGTIFEIHVKNDSSELQVIEGLVEVSNKTKTLQTVTSGQAIELRNDQIEEISYESRLFKQHGERKVISINLGGHAAINGETGAVAVGNWNNILKSGSRLINNKGEQTTAYIEYSKAIPFDQKSRNTTGTEKDNLFGGLLVGGVLPNDENAIKSFTLNVSEIPFKKYDLYVYYRLGGEGVDQTFNLSVNNQHKFLIHRDLNELKTFTRWRSSKREDSGNFVLVKDLADSQAKILLSLPENAQTARQWFIAGLQIVETK